jgi:tripartite-type tricarboxylate transporter receptor subunit TctC
VVSRTGILSIINIYFQDDGRSAEVGSFETEPGAMHPHKNMGGPMLKSLILTVMLGIASSVSAVTAAEFPNRAVTIVVPSAAGGLSDIIARRIAEKAGPLLKTTMIIENRAGASGAIGGSYVQRAQPDGYTILLANGTSHGALPALSKKPPYDPVKDFKPVARVGETQLALVASKKLNVKNAQELLEYARKNPGKLSYGSFGHASAGHLYGEVMKKENGIDMEHVPYKSEALAVQGIMAGEIDLAMIVSAKPFVDQGQVVLIGITSPEGAEAYPGWPTLASQGVKGFSQARGFQAFFAPVGTPQPIVDALAKAIAEAVAMPDVRKNLLELGVSPAKESPQEFPALFRSLVAQWKSIVDASGVTSE